MGSKWLFKTDPEIYSFSDLERDGKATWDGVTNSLAPRHLRDVRGGSGPHLKRRIGRQHNFH